jgi:hypothetical protein
VNPGDDVREGNIVKPESRDPKQGTPAGRAGADRK